MLKNLSNYHIPVIENMAKFGLLATVFFVPLSTSLGEIFYLLTLILFLLAGHWKTKFKALVSNPTTYIFWCCAAIVILGMLYTKAPVHLSFHVAYKYSWLLLTPLLIVLVNSDENLRKRAVHFYLCAIAWTLLFSYMQHFQLIKIFGMDDSIFKDHIVNSFLMIFAALLLTQKIISSVSVQYRLLYILFIGLILFDMWFLSVGRTGYVLIFFMTFFIWIKLYGFRKLFLPIAALLVCFALAFSFSPHFSQGMKELIKSAQTYKKDQPNSTSLGIRVSEAHVAVSLVKQKIISGYGTGSLKIALATTQLKRVQNTDLLDVGYMNILFQFGLIGCVVFACFFYFIWKSSKRLKAGDQLILQGLLLTILISLFMNEWLTETTVSHLFSVFSAVFLAPLPLLRFAEKPIVRVHEYSSHTLVKYD